MHRNATRGTMSHTAKLCAHKYYYVFANSHATNNFYKVYLGLFSRYTNYMCTSKRHGITGNCNGLFFDITSSLPFFAQVLLCLSLKLLCMIWQPNVYRLGLFVSSLRCPIRQYSVWSRNLRFFIVWFVWVILVFSRKYDPSLKMNDSNETNTSVIVLLFHYGKSYLLPMTYHIVVLHQ